MSRREICWSARLSSSKEASRSTRIERGGGGLGEDERFAHRLFAGGKIGEQGIAAAGALGPVVVIEMRAAGEVPRQRDWPARRKFHRGSSRAGGPGRRDGPAARRWVRRAARLPSGPGSWAAGHVTQSPAFLAWTQYGRTGPMALRTGWQIPRTDWCADIVGDRARLLMGAPNPPSSASRPTARRGG